MSHTVIARNLIDALETGKGWGACKDSCREGATFSIQDEPVVNSITLMGYAEWMRVLMSSISNGRYMLKLLAVQDVEDTVIAKAEFYGTQIGEGGPVPLFGNSVVSEYTYFMTFEGDKISHLNKVWSDIHAVHGLRQT